MTDNKRLTLSIAEAATELGISKSMAYDLARRRRLPGAIRIGHRRIVVSRFQLERYLQTEGKND
jgi:excisionase family DNA binding protein